MQFQSTPLPANQSKPLREWLRQSEFDTLILVLKSRALEHEFAAVKQRIEGADGTYPDHETAAKGEAMIADKYLAAVKILTDLHDEPTNKPITTTAILP